MIGMLAIAVAMADDVEDIRAAELDSRAQEKAGNADGVYDYMVPDFSIYPPTARLVSHGWDDLFDILLFIECGDTYQYIHLCLAENKYPIPPSARRLQ